MHAHTAIQSIQNQSFIRWSKEKIVFLLLTNWNGWFPVFDPPNIISFMDAVSQRPIAHHPSHWIAAILWIQTSCAHKTGLFIGFSVAHCKRWCINAKDIDGCKLSNVIFTNIDSEFYISFIWAIRRSLSLRWVALTRANDGISWKRMRERERKRKKEAVKKKS